jgi:hypothetical protein
MYKFAIGVLAAAMTFAACGAGSSKSGTSGDGATTTTTSSGDKSNASDTTTKGGAGGGGGDDSNELTDLLAKGKAANVKVTYLSDGERETFAQDGKGKTSVRTSDSFVVTDDKTTISCDGPDAGAKCTDYGSAALGGGFTQFFTGLYTSLAALKSTAFAGHTSSQTIAGRDASCVTVSVSDFGGVPGGGAAGGSATACLDKDTGVVMKYSTTDGSTTKDELVATEFGESSASDFDVPSTPETLPSGSIPNVSIPDVSIPGIGNQGQ